MTKRKKVIILSCMIALLAVTAVANLLITAPQTSANEYETESSANYFANYRSQRLTSRNEEILQLDAIISASSMESAERSEAISLKTDLTKITETEFLLENLIKAYGFEDVVVVIGLETENVNVVAKIDELTTDDAILIYTIIEEECSVSPENVKIIPIS